MTDAPSKVQQAANLSIFPEQSVGDNENQGLTTRELLTAAALVGIAGRSEHEYGDRLNDQCYNRMGATAVAIADGAIRALCEEIKP